MDYRKYCKAMVIVKGFWVFSFLWLILWVFQDLISAIGLQFLFPGGPRVTLVLSLGLFIASWLTGIVLTFLVKKKCPVCGEPLRSHTFASTVSVVYSCPKCQFRHETRTNFDIDNLDDRTG